MSVLTLGFPTHLRSEFIFCYDDKFVYTISDVVDGTRLNLFPSSGPMFGGNPVEISEACFEPQQKIECQFGDKVG